jgi:tetratricopeptide (TPR) repeat protein
LFSSLCYSQQVKNPNVSTKSKNDQKTLDTLNVNYPTTNRTIISYFVEEKINHKFGGYTTSYEVSRLSLIPKHSLGPNNIRIITPHYKNENKELLIKSNIQQNNLVSPAISAKLGLTSKVSIDPLKQINQEQISKESKEQIIETKVELTKSEISHDFIYVNITETYERIAAKGYKSVELFKKLGDTYFLKGNHIKSSKWYGELFKLNSNQDSEFFYRYATSLRSIGQVKEANSLLELMNKKAGEVVSSKQIKNKMFNIFRINAKH